MPSPIIFTSIINSYLPEPHAALLNGILFGIDLKTSKEFYIELKMVGLLHLVVLSGINITILASIISTFTVFLGKRISILITILMIILFILFVGVKAPIIRAGIMGILTLVAIISGRKTLALYSLFLSGLITLIIKPQWLSSLSFHLSYAATLGIILFGSVKHTKSKNPADKISGVIWKEIKPSLAAQLFTVPIIFLAFKQISLIAPVSNLLVAPLMPPLMIFGFLTAILGKIHYLLGLIPSYICYGLLTYVIFIIKTLAKIPYIFFSF